MKQPTEYYLPGATARALSNERIQQCKNLGLLLYKYPPRTALQNNEQKGHWLRTIAYGKHIDTQLAEQMYRRWLSMTTALGAQHFQALTAWRIVVGLGSPTVMETGLTLHHLYGLPFIPGNALKGLCRAYVTGEIPEHKSPKIADDDETVRRIFGSPEHSGTVIFFDAMPLNGQVTLTLDIINAHYTHDYTEKKPPTSDQNPNPVTFLAVTNTTFAFALAARIPEHTGDVTLVTAWLQEALQEYGIGSKTSSGYGYFNV